MRVVQSGGEADCIARLGGCYLDFRGLCACCNFLGRDTPRGNRMCTISKELGSRAGLEHLL